MIDKKNLVEDIDFNFILDRLDDNFNINKNYNTVIFGPNGIGKTSLYKYSKKHNNDKTVYLDYLDNRDAFIKNKKTIIINPFYAEIQDLQDAFDEIKNNMKIAEYIKSSYNVTSEKQVKKINIKLSKFYKERDIAELNLTTDLIDEINNQDIIIEPINLVKNYTAFKELSNIEDELSNYHDSILFRSLELLDKILNEESCQCPVCGTDNLKMKNIVQDKISILKNIKSEIINNIIMENIDIEINEKLLSAYQSAANNLPEDLLGEYAVCAGNKERLEFLKESIDSKTDISNQIDDLLDKQESLYNLLKNEEQLLKEELTQLLHIEVRNIDFNDDARQLTIKLKREIETYSTGEINYLSFLIKIYEFVSSDNKYLVLDDPISSLDLVNHYRMAYELVKRANEQKKIIILTHSVSLMNTINSQHKEKFKFYYLEKYDNKLFIDEIVGFSDNVITLSNIKDDIDESKLIEAIIKREEDYNRCENKLFHFNNFEEIGEYPDLSNQTFIDFIDNFKLERSTKFLHNAYFKIKTIVALRVWLEYKMWLILNNSEDKETYMRKDTLGKKISYFTSIESNPILRTKLMKSKVMLNEGSHYQSQIMPFSYAIHISLDDLKSEVEYIKNIFENYSL